MRASPSRDPLTDQLAAQVSCLRVSEIVIVTAAETAKGDERLQQGGRLREEEEHVV